MLTYKDRTFCINEECVKKCYRYLTYEIQEQARRFGLPLSVASFICLEKTEEGKYEKMS